MHVLFHRYVVRRPASWCFHGDGSRKISGVVDMSCVMIMSSNG